MIVLTLLVGNRYLVANEILVCISLIIMLTDDLMMKNSEEMIEDFSKINYLKKHIEDYSMMEDRDMEHVTLWGKYIAYAVSFGCADKICKRLNGLYIDDDMLEILDDKIVKDYISIDYKYFL